MSRLFLFGARLLPNYGLARHLPLQPCLLERAARTRGASAHHASKASRPPSPEHEFPTTPLASGLRGAGGSAVENSATVASNVPRRLLRHLNAVLENHSHHLQSAAGSTPAIRRHLDDIALQWEWVRSVMELQSGAAYYDLVANASESILRSLERVATEYEALLRG